MMTFADLVHQVRLRLTEAREKLGPGFPWYPYDTLSSLLFIERLLGPDPSALLALAGDRPVLDVGCADGDLSFALERLGCKVHAIDNPVTNFNAMTGVRALAESLDSRVEIIEADLDSRFELPANDYGLALVLGLIYHLKNPFYLLEFLSKRARYCLLSTALTAYVPGLYENVQQAPLAFLADVYEIDRDSTNYWLLTEAGLRRLLARSGWELVHSLLVSDPARSGTGSIGGQRAFCLARSKYVNTPALILFGKGWHLPEGEGWRWTEKTFSIRIESACFTGADELRLELYVPDILLRERPFLTLNALANGQPLAPELLQQPGVHTYRRRLPVRAASVDVRVDFWLDYALEPDEADPRQRGIVVRSISTSLLSVE